MILKKKFSQNIFAYSFVSENSKHFFLFEKKMAAGGGEASPSPPKNASFFFTCSLKSERY